jgi:transmembrane sensor
VIRPPLRNLIVPPLDRSRLQAVWQRVEERRARAPKRMVQWQLLLAGAVGLVLGIVVMRLRVSEPAALRLAGQGSLGTLASDRDARLVQLSDGSSLLLGRDTRLELVDNSGHAVGWRLARGRAEFEVRPGGPRRWTIRTDVASVEVVGTHFVVEQAAAGTSVSVTRGEVLVRGAGVAGRVRSLVAGESLLVRADFPSPSAGAESPAASVPSPAASASSLAASAPSPAASVPSPPASVSSPASSASSSPASVPSRPRAPSSPAPTRTAHSRATPVPPTPPEPRSSAPADDEPAPQAHEAPRPDADALLKAADRARRSGQLAEAAALLQQVADGAGDAQQAALASFTLGRLYAGPLARPADAAHAFERALALGLPQALTEDTLLRQAEAYEAAGDRRAARDVAARYLTRFPAGRHKQRISRWLDEAAPPPR